MAVMVALSIMATAQTIDNPISRTDFSEAQTYEWYTLSDRPNDILVFGDHDDMDSLAMFILTNAKLNFMVPDTSYIDEVGDQYKTWWFVHKNLGVIFLTHIQDENYTHIVLTKAE